MQNYPNKIYLSASWHRENPVLDRLVAKELMHHGFTVLQDHIKNKEDPPISSWIRRIKLYMRDCDGLVAVLPFREENLQTTSPFIFPELLAAAWHRIPILIFHEQAVLISVSETETSDILSFGSTADQSLLKAEELFALDISDDEHANALLKTTKKLSFPKNLLFGIHAIPSPQKRGLERMIEDFIETTKHKSLKVHKPYALHLLPFVEYKATHYAVASGVFRSTGLECRTALDFQGNRNDQLNQWKEAIVQAEFFIADLSTLRDTCLYEVGLAHGANKDVIIVSRKDLNHLPYGLENAPLIFQYSNRDSLEEVVAKASEKLYRRQVHNFTQDNRSAYPQSIPQWFAHSTLPILVSRVTLAIWMTSVSLCLFIASAFVWFSEIKFENIILSMIPILLGMMGHTRGSREWLEERTSGFLSLLPIASGIFFLVALIIFVLALILESTPFHQQP